MKTKQHGSAASTRQVQELLGSVTKNWPDMTKDEAQSLIGKKPRALKELLRKLFILGKEINQTMPGLPEADRDRLDEIIDLNERFYNEVYNTNLVISDKLYLPHPSQREIFNFPMIINKGLRYDFLWQEVLPQRYKLYHTENNDPGEIIDMDMERRNPQNGSYLIWIRDCQEADPENRRISADLADIMNLNGQTLLERFNHQLMFDWIVSQTKGGFKDGTGQIIKIARTSDYKDYLLDIKNLTLCSESRDSDGQVPLFRWLPHHDTLRLNWAPPDYAFDGLRLRSVVSS